MGIVTHSKIQHSTKLSRKNSDSKNCNQKHSEQPPFCTSVQSFIDSRRRSFLMLSKVSWFSSAFPTRFSRCTSTRSCFHDAGCLPCRLFAVSKPIYFPVIKQIQREQKSPFPLHFFEITCSTADQK